MPVDVIWNKYPNSLTQFDYSGEKLKQHWSTLSAGPKIPWPDEEYVENMLKIYPEILERTVKQANEINSHPSLRYIEKKDFKPIALALQEVFRLHYQGEFQAAYQLGKKLGPLGLAPGLYSKLIHTTFLVNDTNLKTERYLEVDKILSVLLPIASDYEFLLLGDTYQKSRRLELLSMSEALLSGLLGPTQQQSKKLHSLSPNTPMYRALIAGLDAGIIERAGGFLASVSYGASESDAIEHFNQAMIAEPQLAVLYNEYIQALLRMGLEKSSEPVSTLMNMCLNLTVYSAEEALNQSRCNL